MAQQRLAPGKANLFHAVASEDLCQTDDLLEGQHLVMRQELILVVEHIPGHAVGAAKVATVGDGDAQVAQVAVASVHKRACRIGKRACRTALERRNAQVSFACAFISARSDLEVHSVPGRKSETRAFAETTTGLVYRNKACSNGSRHPQDRSQSTRADRTLHVVSEMEDRVLAPCLRTAGRRRLIMGQVIRSRA